MELNIFLKKYSILTFSAETTSHEFRLNVTRDYMNYTLHCMYLISLPFQPLSLIFLRVLQVPLLKELQDLFASF